MVFDYCPYKAECLFKVKEDVNCTPQYKECIIYKLIAIEDAGGCEDSKLIDILEGRGKKDD